MNIIHSRKDKYFTESLEDLTDLIKNPVDVPKEEARLFNYTIYDLGNFRRNQELNPPRATKHLILDFDDGTRISSFLDQFQKVKYYLYSSKSSKIQNEKFRVVIPLKNIYSQIEFNYMVELFKSKYPILKHIDKTCLQLSRFFFLPNRGEHYNFIINEGAQLDEKVDISVLSKYVSNKEELFRAIQSTKPVIKENYEYSRDVSSDRRVLVYLNTPYYKLTGNGDSSSNLYRALAVAICNNDNETLLKIESKALSERWKVKELERMKNNISKHRR